jgi:uncharacterized RDD family membrane protein YckC
LEDIAIIDTERYRTARKRIWAAIVDYILFMPLLFVDCYFLFSDTNVFIVIAWNVFTTFLPIFYSIFAHYRYGRTIGKWVARVKVLDVSETRNLSLKQAFLRDGVFLSLELIGLLYYGFWAIKTGEPGYLLHNFIDFPISPFGLWTLLEIITMLANSKRRAVHDYIAGSVVVRAE